MSKRQGTPSGKRVKRQSPARDAKSPPWSEWAKQFCFTFPFFLVDRLGKGAILVALAYVAIYLPVREVAGKDTEFILSLIGEFAADRWLYLLATLLFGGSWYAERHARKKYIERHGRHEKELERQLDPDRGSSGLRDDGTPPK